MWHVDNKARRKCPGIKQSTAMTTASGYTPTLSALFHDWVMHLDMVAPTPIEQGSMIFLHGTAILIRMRDLHGVQHWQI